MREKEGRNMQWKVQPKFKSYNNEDINDVVPQEQESLEPYSGQPKHEPYISHPDASIVTNTNT
jgi:hypothetical protein